MGQGKDSDAANIQHVLERAISVRKRCAAWFQQTDSRNKFSNSRHQYFIDVLQKAADMLGGKAAPSSGSGTAQTPGKVQERAGTEIDVMRYASLLSNPPPFSFSCRSSSVFLQEYWLTLLHSNYFSALTFEHIEDNTEDDIATPDMSSHAAPNKNGQGKKNKQAHAIYELEEGSEWEVAFKIFCFFEDLHTLQGELRRTWKAYCSDDLDILAAIIVTTAAIGLVSRTEKDIHWAHPGVFNPTRSYQDLALMIFYSESLRQGDDPDEHIDSDEMLDLEITPFKEFMYLPTGRTLMKVAQMRQAFQKGSYPVPILPMRFNYVGCPEFLESPRMRKFEAEDETICQLIIDLSLQEDFKKGFNKLKKTSEEAILWNILPINDVFTGAMRKVWKGAEVTVESVFASRVLLDILDICGSNFKGLELLTDE